MHKYQKEIQNFLMNYIRNYRALAEGEPSQEDVAELLRISSRAYGSIENGGNGMSASSLMFFLSILPEESVLAMLNDFRSYMKDIEQQKENI